MTALFTATQTLAAIPGLSPARLAAFIAAGLVTPLPAPSGPSYRPVDLARLALLCDLADHFDLEGDALGMVIELIDQLHATRQHLHAMAQAVVAEPQDLRQRVGARFLAILAV